MHIIHINPLFDRELLKLQLDSLHKKCPNLELAGEVLGRGVPIIIRPSSLLDVVAPAFLQSYPYRHHTYNGHVKIGPI